MDIEENSDRGLCLLSFDGGGPGAYSQLLLIKEYMSRLAVELGVTEDELYPADYFDMMGGVGFGGIAAITLGHLRMTVEEAIDTLLTVAASVFPYDPDTKETPEANMLNLKSAIEDILERRGIPVDTKMNDKRGPSTKCKVSIYTTTSTDVSQPKIFRTYPHRGSTLNPTIVEALCATMAIPSFFPAVKIGPRGREQTFAGGPLGANNPTRELLKEAGIAFGQDKRVAQVISLGTGRPNVVPLEAVDPADMSSQLLKALYTDCETVASELSTRLINVDAYVRLNVEGGLEASSLDDWRGLGAIEQSTNAYVETSAVTRLLEGSLRYLQNRIGTATLAQINQSSSVKQAIKTAPALSPYHVVRQKESRVMFHHLVDQPSSNQKIFVITGIGGCGKTQMVSYFLQEKGFHYMHSVFVDASSLSSLKADLQAWAQSHGDGHEQDVWEDALRILASDIYDGRWILILDNADNLTVDLAPFLPKCYKGTIIITSRNRSTGDLANTHHLELGEMEADEALSTLLRAARRQEPLSPEELSDANSLTKTLGYLAVALVQAGTYCHQLSTFVQGVLQPFTFAQYTGIFFVQRAELMNKPESSSLDNYQLGAYTAFDLSYKAISKSSKDFLHFAASFQHSSISLAMFSAAAKDQFGDPYDLLPRPDDHGEITDSLKQLLCVDGKWNEVHAHDMIRTLRSFSLISASSIANTVFLHLHPLVCAWARDILPSKTLNHDRMATQVITSCSSHENIQLYRYLALHIHDLLHRTPYDSQHVNDLFVVALVLSDQAYYDDAERLLHHVVQRLRDVKGRDDSNAAMVSGWLAVTYRSHGKWDKAEELQLELLEQHKRVQGDKHPDTIIAQSNLSVIYHSQGRSGDAEKVQLEVLEKLRQTKGPDHPDTTVAAGNLASTYHNQGRIQEAEKLELETLKQRRITLGKDAPLSLVAASNLAGTYRAQGRLSEAEALQFEVWDRRKRLLGKNHQDTLDAAQRLSGIYADQGRWKEAEELKLEILEQQTKLMGDAHPDTLLATSNLATLYYAQGRWSDAERLTKQVLEHRKSTGEDHPATITAAGNLAAIYSAQGKWSEAEKLEMDVLQRRIKQLGENHPDTNHSRSNLASVLLEQGRHKEAEELQLDVLHQRKKFHGMDHPDTMLSINNLARTYYAQGRWSEAEKLEVDLLERRKRVAGHDHPDTIVAMSNLALTYSAQSKLDEAEKLVLEVWARRLQALGKDNPDTITTAENLAAIYLAQKRYKEAEKLQLDVLEQRKKVIGKDHPRTIAAAANLAVTYSSQGRGKEAEKLQLEVLEQRTGALGPDHPETIRTAANLAVNYFGQGRFAEAEKLELGVLDQRTRLLGKDHPDTIATLANLGSTYRSQGHLKEAERLYEEVLERRRRVMGRDHIDTVKAADELGGIYAELDKWGDSEVLAREVLERHQRLLGEDHTTTILAASNLAAAYMCQGRYEDAEDMQQEILEQRRRVTGKDHPETIAAAEHLALCYRKHGRYMQAAELQSEALEQKRTLFGLVHPETLRAEVNLAGIYVMAEDWQTAASVLSLAVQNTLMNLGKEHAATKLRVTSLAGVLGKLGLDDAAQEVSDLLL